MMSKRFGRRGFFARSLAASAGAAALDMGFEEKALMAHLAEAAETSEKEEPVKGLPKGKIGDVTISRVIVGSNLFGGGAHARNLMYVSELTERYFTHEKVMDTLQLCEENGINTNVGGVDMVNEYNKERGGKMQVIGQLDPDHYDWSDDNNPDGSVTTTKGEIRETVEWAANEGCVGAFLLGSRGDRWVKAKRLDLIDEFVSCVKRNGMIAGVGGHDKRVPVACEEAGIDFDFYVKTFHHDNYWSATPKDQRVDFNVDSGSEQDHDNIWCIDPEATKSFMEKVDKPWIAYKTLAAGAIHPSDGLKWVFKHGADFALLGMFDFQVTEDVIIAKKVLAMDDVKNRTRPWRA